MPTSRPLRSSILTLRLTPGERALLAGRARVAGLTLSSFLRRAAMRHRVRSSGRRLAEADVEELVRLGVRLNGFAHASNTTRRLVGVPELRELLAELRSTARELAAGLPE